MGRQNNYLIVGPLAEAAERVQDLASDLFTSLMMIESMERLETAEKEYKIACDNDDADSAKQKELQLKACESTVRITIAMMDDQGGAYQ